MNQPFLITVKDFLKKTIAIYPRAKRYAKFERFINNELKLSQQKFKKPEQIKGDYDLIICGSDQIWRYYELEQKAGFDYAYFANFLSNPKIKKVSYAASIGDRILNDKEKSELYEAISSLDIISVREEYLESLLISKTSYEIKQVLDPVFLLDIEEWKKLIPPSKTRKPYLLYYQLLDSEEADKLSTDIASERKVKIIKVKGFASIMPKERSKGNTGPLDFLSLIYHADFIISSSYHGIIFSIIFKKDFLGVGFQYGGHRIKYLLARFC